jgi:hypothetical protein
MMPFRIPSEFWTADDGCGIPSNATFAGYTGPARVEQNDLSRKRVEWHLFALSRSMESLYERDSYLPNSFA